jgi:hypothetical protein
MKGLYINSERCASVTIRGFCAANNIEFLEIHNLDYQPPHRNPRDREEKSIYKNFGKLGNTICESAKTLIGEKDYNSRLVFTSVRNPYSRAVSTWKHHTWSKEEMRMDLSFLQFCKLINKESFTSLFDPILCDDLPYQEYLNTDLHKAIMEGGGIDKKGRTIPEKMKTKWLWANAWWHGFSFNDQFFKNGQPLVNEFVRVENLNEDLEKICTKLGIKNNHEIKKTNISLSRGEGGLGPMDNQNLSTGLEKKHYSEYYCDESKKLITEKYQKDIEYFGYKF